MNGTAESTDIWRKHAQQWQHVGQPLRPTPFDTQVMQRLARQCHQGNGGRPLAAVLLGVTEEIANMDWPPGTELIAIDRSLAMVKEIWRGDNASQCAICGDWFNPPLLEHSRDLIVGDGALNALPAAADYAAGLKSLRAMLVPDGHVIMRLFIRPEGDETADDVFAALAAGAIGNFHIFKFRLAMALQPTFAEGIRLDDIWRAWDNRRQSATAGTEKLAWPVSAVHTIEAYRGVSNRFTFPTLKELRAELNREFLELACEVPDYEMGERCPSFLLAPLSGPR